MGVYSEGDLFEGGWGFLAAGHIRVESFLPLNCVFDATPTSNSIFFEEQAIFR